MAAHARKGSAVDECQRAPSLLRIYLMPLTPSSADRFSGSRPAVGFDGDDPSWAIAATQPATRLPRSETRPLPPEPEAVETPDFWPAAPEKFSDTGLREPQVESLVLKYLLNMAQASGRDIASQVGLPFRMLQSFLYSLKEQQLVSIKSDAPLSDYHYELTSNGVERARRYAQQSTYFGSAPVPLEQYVESVNAQSTRRHSLQGPDIERAFSDLVLGANVIHPLGEALNMGRGVFLHGAPGNGKSALAERIVQAYGPTIWIPRALSVGGEIVRLFDSIHHHEVPLGDNLAERNWDRRWVRIQRPTILVGSEMELRSLEITTNPLTKISEAPLQLKSNCGALIIDDFGRNRFRPEELLNRLVVPLERHTDSLHLDSGRTFQIPFDCMIVFSSNLDPRQLVDEAFLRRIPFKVRVADPTPDQFKEVFRREAAAKNLAFEEADLDYLVDQHYRRQNCPLRFCHPRDLINIVTNACEYHGRSRIATRPGLDEAIHRYRIETAN